MKTSNDQQSPVRVQPVVGLRGTARCTRCGYKHHDLRLDKLDMIACARWRREMLTICGGKLVAVRKRQQPNDQAQRPRTKGAGPATEA